MINPKTGQRELAYVVTITDVQPIDGYDRVEEAMIRGWHCVVGKGDFKPSDKAVYFEVDSLLPADRFADFEFLAKKHFKVKTQKMCKRISQGLLLTFEQCGLNAADYNEGDFLTDIIGVVYADPADNIRKGKDGKKNINYNLWFTSKLKKYVFLRKFVKTKIGAKICVALFKAKKKSNWPAFVIKSDEERVQNLSPSVFINKNVTYEITEKRDGTSTTVAIQRTKRGYKTWICSRNVVVFDGKTIKPGGYYEGITESNPYITSAEKYHLIEFLKDYMDRRENAQWAYIQGETFGKNIQKRDYGLNDTVFEAFTLSSSLVPKYSYTQMVYILNDYAMRSGYTIFTVPILSVGKTIPNSSDDIMAMAPGQSIGFDEGMREGIVWRCEQDPQFSFKAVDPEFSIKYHG